MSAKGSACSNLSDHAPLPRKGAASPLRRFRFLSQSFHVAEQFTGMPGQYVPLKETLRGFRMILNGECDDLPESAFLFAGTIDDVFAKAKKG